MDTEKLYPVYLTANQIDDLYGFVSGEQYDLERLIDSLKDSATKETLMEFEHQWKSLNYLMRILHDKSIEIQENEIG